MWQWTQFGCMDPVTGGETYYAHFPAGSRFELHWHSHAEYAVVLRGTVTHTLGDVSQRLTAGDYVIVPAKTGCEEELLELAPEVDGILTCWMPVRECVIQRATRCLCIGRYGIGLDNIDVCCATRLGAFILKGQPLFDEQAIEFG